MKRPNRSLGILFLICAAFFSLQIAPRFWGDSIIEDEEWELTAAYSYWKSGDVQTPCCNPAPGALCALPLLFMDLKPDPFHHDNFPDRSLWFLFMANASHLTAITVWSRAVGLLLGLLVGFLLFLAVRDGPFITSAATLVLWAFEPTLLAYYGTAKADPAMAFWFFLCLFYYARVQDRKKGLSFAGVGFLAGMTVVARYNGLLILPVLLALETARLKDLRWDWKKFSARAPQWFWGLAGGLGAITLTFLPGTWQDPHHSSPFHFFFQNLRFYTDSRSSLSGLTTFFAGHFWPQGSYLYFPYHLFFKTTLPFFGLLLLGVGGKLMDKIQMPRWYWMPPLVYLGLFFLMDKSMTIRHLLPVCPFLLLIAGKALGWLWDSTRRSPLLVRSVPMLLLAWHPASVLCNFPHHIAYTNDFLSGTQKASLLDSTEWNLGQDMKRLAWLGKARGWKKVKLVTAGRTDPYFYGLAWEPWTRRDLVQPQPGTVYVMDPSILNHPDFAAYFTRNSSWIWDCAPTGNIGGTLYYYEIAGTPDPDPDLSETIPSFPYYPKGIPPYRQAGTNK